MDTTASPWEFDRDEGYEAAFGELKRRFSAWVGQRDEAVDPDTPGGLLHGT